MTQSQRLVIDVLLLAAQGIREKGLCQGRARGHHLHQAMYNASVAVENLHGIVAGRELWRVALDALAPAVKGSVRDWSDTTPAAEVIATLERVARIG